MNDFKMNVTQFKAFYNDHALQFNIYYINSYETNIEDMENWKYSNEPNAVTVWENEQNEYCFEW